jgi:2-polyprenyl-3-methyl-5-hydroxy-6-metoxy-1,4-benzoquinol methylase
MWWFVPPDTPKNSSNENPCSFLTNNGDMLPEGSLSVLQQQGDTIYVPKGWWYAIDDWNTAVGMRMAGMADQMIDSLPRSLNEKIYPMPWTEGYAFQTKMTECGVEFDWSNPSSWTWFQGDLNEYYNELIRSDSKRNPQEISSYAVHRWLGKDKSTLVHYELIHGTIQHVIIGNDSDHRNNLRVLDAGCGLGAGLMWFETYAAESWTLVGHTISTAQLDFIQNKIPSHQFDAVLKSYDDLDVYKKDGARFDAMYSIEAFVHSPDERNTLKQWSEALAKGGIIVIIDDFLSVGVDKEAEDVQLYAKSWMSNVLLTTSSLADMAETFGLELIIDRDLGSEYQVVKRNYRNKLPDIRPTKEKHHQGWLGSGMRQRLMVQGKLTYRMVVFQKKGQK